MAADCWLGKARLGQGHSNFLSINRTRINRKYLNTNSVNYSFTKCDTHITYIYTSDLPIIRSDTMESYLSVVIVIYFALIGTFVNVCVCV